MDEDEKEPEEGASPEEGNEDDTPPEPKPEPKLKDDAADELERLRQENAAFKKAERERKLEEARKAKDFEAERKLIEQERDEAIAALKERDEADVKRAREAHRASLTDAVATELGVGKLVADALLLKLEADGEDLSTFDAEKGAKRLATRIKSKDPDSFKRPTGGSPTGQAGSSGKAPPNGVDVDAFRLGQEMSKRFRR